LMDHRYDRVRRHIGIALFQTVNGCSIAAHSPAPTMNQLLAFRTPGGQFSRRSQHVCDEGSRVPRPAKKGGEPLRPRKRLCHAGRHPRRQYFMDNSGYP
jgi:hypothetical protein